VNQSFARKFGLGPDAVGKFMSQGNDSLDTQIVGLVTDAKYSEVKQEIPRCSSCPTDRSKASAP